jgi:hypothetical protein
MSPSGGLRDRAQLSRRERGVIATLTRGLPIARTMQAAARLASLTLATRHAQMRKDVRELIRRLEAVGGAMAVVLAHRRLTELGLAV